MHGCPSTLCDVGHGETDGSTCKPHHIQFIDTELAAESFLEHRAHNPHAFCTIAVNRTLKALLAPGPVNFARAIRRAAQMQHIP